MFYEKVDLYNHFSVPREGHEGGILTVYRRERYGDITPKRRPAILVIPGGGYETVSAREGEPVAIKFLAEGFTAFLLEYSVKAAYPVPLVEAAMAMAYIREKAEEYVLYPDKVAAIGFSAGGHLAALLATLYEDKAIHTAIGSKNVRPDAVLLCYAVLTTGEFTHEGTASVITGGDETLREKLSPEKHVTSKCPPVFLFHTLEDGCVTVENALNFAMACKKAKIPFEAHIFERGWHGVSLASRETEDNDFSLALLHPIRTWVDLALEWLKLGGFEVDIYQVEEH